MKYFTDNFFKFFKQLEKNNNKEWFNSHREMYESEIKEPFRRLVEDVNERLLRRYPELNRNLSKAIFRINRDIRFSKDKSPYKLHVAAVFTRTGTRDEYYPGFYLHLGNDDLMAGGGKWYCSKEEIAKIRQEIYYNPERFAKLLKAKPFHEKFGTLQGEKNKVLPAEYKEFAKEQPLIANKRFWYYTELTRQEVTGDRLDALVYACFKATFDMNDFLWEAISAE